LFNNSIIQLFFHFVSVTHLNDFIPCNFLYLWLWFPFRMFLKTTYSYNFVLNEVLSFLKVTIFWMVHWIEPNINSFFVLFLFLFLLKHSRSIKLMLTYFLYNFNLNWIYKLFFNNIIIWYGRHFLGILSGKVRLGFSLTADNKYKLGKGLPSAKRFLSFVSCYIS